MLPGDSRKTLEPGNAAVPLPDYVTVVPPRAAADPPVVSVVIPAYNESKRIGPYLDAIAAYIAEKKAAMEVLVANDGSRDDTAAFVRAKMDIHPHLGLVDYAQNRGKGHAVRMGMLAARGNLRLFADADGSTPIAELERLRAKIEREGFDIAVGSRQYRSPEVQRDIKFHRYVIGQGFRILRRIFLKIDVLDSQCGFKLFSQRAAEAIFPRTKIDGFAFDVELLHLAGRAGFKTAEVAVNWHDTADSRVNLLTDPFKMFFDMLRVRGLHRKTSFDGTGRS